MITVSLTLDSFTTYVVVGDIVLLLSYVFYVIQKKKRIEKSINSITNFIAAYFIDDGPGIKVSCYKLEGNKRFVALIESPPLKRFRYYNLLESNLIIRIFDVTGNTLEKVYWRFPITLHKGEIAVPEDDSSADKDLYFSTGVDLAQKQNDIKVGEVSWDEYEKNK